MIETALRTAGRQPEVHNHRQYDIKTGVFAPDIYNQKKPVLHKMHGSVEDGKSMVVTQSDYIRYLASLSDPDRGMPHFFRRQLLPQSHLLFLGYALRDWDFLAIWEGVMEACRSTNSSLMSYAIVQSCTTREKNYLLKRNVMVCEADLTQVATELARTFKIAPARCGLAPFTAEGGAP